jgi:WD40 repeat protein
VLHLFQIGPLGILPVRAVPIGQHFQQQQGSASSGNKTTSSKRNSSSSNGAAISSTGRIHEDGSGFFDVLGLGTRAPSAVAPMSSNAMVTCVAWSPNVEQDVEEEGSTNRNQNQSLIAAAGSNGAIVVFQAETLFDLTATTSPVEAVLTQHHVRAVNGLDWHPSLPGLLLSASQDGTVLLWERHKQDEESNEDEHEEQQHAIFHSNNKSQQHKTNTFSKLFGGNKKNVVPSKRTYSWHCQAKFEPKSEAVRDIQWSPFYEHYFALVTTSGSLIVYHKSVTVRALVKLTAHSGDAATLDWHPHEKHIVATGGASDRSVKVWDLRQFLDLEGTADEGFYNMTVNSYSVASRADSVNSNEDSAGIMPDATSSSVSVYVPALQDPAHLIIPPPQSWQQRVQSPSSSNATGALTNTSRHKSIGSVASGGTGAGASAAGLKQQALLHVLAVSASVTRIRWRPPAQDAFAWETQDQQQHDHASGSDGESSYPQSQSHPYPDRHDTMMAVATAPIKGASAGGSGVLSLWSYDRPFVPLSVVEGHKDGAVTDFEWLETPIVSTLSQMDERGPSNMHASPSRRRSTQGWNSSQQQRRTEGGREKRRLTGSSPNEMEAILFDNSKNHDDRMSNSKNVRIWQHVLSVGRDGRCVIQSFVRGDKPISRVPPSCFAMANLSPFQKGYGSLQIFSVHQMLPTNPENALLMTGLRSDKNTNGAPGIFREPLCESTEAADQNPVFAHKKFPSSPPDLVFNVVDQGDLNDESQPVEEEKQIITVAPEVVHLSRFASRYVLYTNEKLQTRVELCLHNASVAESLKCGNLAHMWRMVAFMLESCGGDGLPDLGEGPSNVMQFVIQPTLKSLLEERAEDGDVQTCVALCELLGVIQPDSTVRIPDLDINMIREWYLSYIDLLKGKKNYSP